MIPVGHKKMLYQLFWNLDKLRTNPALFAKRKILHRFSYYSRDELRELQLRNLKRIVEHAYETVPFYRKIYQEHGFLPGQLKNLEDVTRLPIIEKKDIQNNLEEMVSTRAVRKNLIRDATGGSTGQPLEFYRDREGFAWFEAADAFVKSLWGVKPWSRKAILWGADRDLPEMNRRDRLRMALDRVYILNSFNMNEERMDAFAATLLKWNPEYVIGYATSLYFFAKFLKSRNISGIFPIAIRSSAETLFDFQRSLIGETMGGGLYNFYGSREVNNIAFECSAHCGLHEMSPLRLIEVTDGNGSHLNAGEPGVIIVTDLVGMSMPLIRYKTEDIGVLSDGECSCGLSFPLLEEIKGRSSDIITLQSGRLIHGEFFTHLIYGFPGIETFQVHQTSLEDIYVYLQVDASFDVRNKEVLKRKFRDSVGSQARLKMRYVDKIPVTKSGKHRFTISDVPYNI